MSRPIGINTLRKYQNGNNGNGKSRQSSEEYLKRRMPHKLLQLSCSDLLSFTDEHLVDDLGDLLDGFRLFACFATDTYGVVHNDYRENCGCRKQRTAPAAHVSAHYRECGNASRMTAGHSAVTRKSFEHKAALCERMYNKLKNLGYKPSNDSNYKYLILKYTCYNVYVYRPFLLICL